MCGQQGCSYIHHDVGNNHMRVTIIHLSRHRTLVGYQFRTTIYQFSTIGNREQYILVNNLVIEDYSTRFVSQ